MGRIFLEHLGGGRSGKVYTCASCSAPLTNGDELVSTRFSGATGRAYLFNKVVNIKESAVQDRIMITGRHMIRDVSCKNCNCKLGWIYEFAVEEAERYKEGRVILEKSLLKEVKTFGEGNESNVTMSRGETVRISHVSRRAPTAAPTI